MGFGRGEGVRESGGCFGRGNGREGREGKGRGVFRG